MTHYVLTGKDLERFAKEWDSSIVGRLTVRFTRHGVQFQINAHEWTPLIGTPEEGEFEHCEHLRITHTNPEPCHAVLVNGECPNASEHVPWNH